MIAAQSLTRLGRQPGRDDALEAGAAARAPVPVHPVCRVVGRVAGARKGVDRAEAAVVADQRFRSSRSPWTRTGGRAGRSRSAAFARAQAAFRSEARPSRTASSIRSRTDSDSGGSPVGGSTWSSRSNPAISAADAAAGVVAGCDPLEQQCTPLLVGRDQRGAPCRHHARSAEISSRVRGRAPILRTALGPVSSVAARTQESKPPGSSGPSRRRQRSLSSSSSAGSSASQARPSSPRTPATNARKAGWTVRLSCRRRPAERVHG